jgi:prepilin-type N-terminal cleavage/methylation domain-containing protein
MYSSQRRCRHAFSLIELLVVIAIMGVLMGLTVGAVQKARAAAGRIQCANNLHQILIAANNMHAIEGFIPGNPYANNVVGSTFYWLLPYIEQKATFENHTYTAEIKTYRCPNDPSVSRGPIAPGNYATNDLLFHSRNGGTQVFIPVSMPAGASNTIMFAEKYAACSNWASVIDGGPVGCFKPAYTAKPNAASPFQVVPGPNAADCALPQSAHAGGILVGMGDGSVRMIHETISNDIWYAANDPNGDGLGSN